MRRRRSQPINSINVVPYLDVLLVLLVIFMITAPLFNQGAVNLPSVGEADVPPPQAGAIVISYHEDGAFSINYPQLDESAKNIGEGELLARLESILVLRADAPIVVEADKDTPLGDVMLFVGKVRIRGGKQIALSVKTGDES
ncbi:MAG: biopolymer transporter ExbD [Gammaproteobacteria bacterium]